MSSRRVLAAVLLCILAGTAPAKSLVVRVQARDFPELSGRIVFKGTSLEIVGGRPGEYYELLLDERDLPVVRSSGLRTEVVVPDLEYWRELVAADGAYHTYDEHVVMLRGWATLYPNICRLESLGPSYEGRWIYGLKISDDPQTEDPSEPEMLIYGVMHGREWAGGEMVRYAVDTLLRNYATDPVLRDWIDRHQLWAFPLMNVDGYSYDYPAQRLWRKNRQPFDGVIGTDPNRNGNGACQGEADLEWGTLVNGSQTSHNPGHQAFAGSRGFSAPESRALTEFFKTRTFLLDVSIHMYTELVLWGWSVTRPTPDNDFIALLGQRCAAAIDRLGGGTYTPQQAGSWYPANMVIEDWTYGWARTIGGFPCPAYTYEVGTTFYQPTGDLDQMQRECFDGLWVMMQHLDSVKLQLKGKVPRPFIASIEQPTPGDYAVHWTPIRPAYNAPDRWELEELQGLSVEADSFEAGTARWVLQGAELSGAQRRSGAYSVFLGNSSNMSNWLVTRDPYPVVSAGDSVTFWTWYTLERNYDVGMCEVSLEGKEWFQLEDRYSGNSGGWVRKAYSLAPWLGKSVFIRFHACSDDGTNSGGMYVDDVHPVPAFSTRNVIGDNITDTLYAFTAKPDGHYYYRVRGHNAAWGWGDYGPLRDVLVGGTGIVAEPPPAAVERPAATAITGIAPSPFSTRAAVSYALARPGPVRLSVHAGDGRQVRLLANGVQGPGRYLTRWDGRDQAGRLVPSGVYLFRLEADRVVVESTIRLR
ncbi:MAG: M14 family zinc carboxypeptidase [bacterium]